ncbi:malonate decarboxylase, alpha subunit [Rhodospirillum rubrum F11]|uniref:Alpha subunit of malonate decarboxylase n=1 Tax=Rhodospirillum rubrum (strain ATCC 11170 / ATH 1.1.1 / DSM 467 / LMG 4362 / NCIMB 8255 / S1) TaxID=269796 RepID=Q2RUS2_RHORT|nr:malonate decarboxylase subunit alpha [Rhodospirillum rubrum]ABC22123.1 alpha subunit of malonate decarboxylase [Rhodospirillum rubrum ATCC 11170]AEO47838.1 malonate decarboxylase, alpha subunit [Rhodospirillum rubrum F11]MBK5953712.1 malonate decarboxylase subunit alpha [Rhodospirillum rubrum]QXG81772.1 malonate decarboxylase subunit alpha [Rhodospirillum rubrum]
MSKTGTDKKWDHRSVDTAERLAAAARFIGPGKEVKAADTVALLEAVIRAGDRVNIEGNNQKQADFLAECLNKVDKSKIHDLHMVQSAVPLPVHLDLFENGIAKKLDFAFGGPQAGRVAKFIKEGKLELGAIHTYLELFGRYFLDLTPRVSLICAYKADRQGNLYTGFNTEDTPTIVEATKFRQGIVIAQVNEIVDTLPRVDIPADWVDVVIESPQPFFLEPLFTRDPALVTDSQILLGMLCLKGIYAEYGVQRINHGIGFLTSAIELMLPTYGEELGLKGKVCTHMILNPHPTMIPAIESGWVDTIHCFGGELGMEEYVAARPDIFFVGPDGTLRSNRAFAQTAGHYALDMFIGGTLQIDKFGNSSTATANRVAGFGGAPNMGCDSKGRRHSTASWLKCGAEQPTLDRQLGTMPRGKRLVVQGVETFGEGRAPVFVDKLDAWELAENAGLDLPPVMIYGDDLTHVVTEEGIAYLNRCPDIDSRMAAIRAVAGYTELGLQAKPSETRALRDAGIVKTPEDLGVDRSRANRSMLAARNIRDLVSWSGGLYNPPARFRNW